MIPAGYMAKLVVTNPEWIQSPKVKDVYSVSNCISDDFADYINFWKHNGFWLFNDPESIKELAEEHGIDISKTTFFYYEAYEYEYDEDLKKWSAFRPEIDVINDITQPVQKYLQGFDVVTFSVKTNPECSPLSCNSLAEKIPVNEHCLFDNLSDAKNALENGFFNNSEPGPFRIFAVYTLENT